MYALHKVEVFSPQMDCAGNIPLGVSNEKMKLKLWPNASASSVKVQLPVTNNGSAALRITDLQERTILRQTFYGHAVDINISRFPDSVYIWKCEPQRLPTPKNS